MKKLLPASRVLRFLVGALFLLGVMLMGLNLYGLTQPLRMPGLGTIHLDKLRFIPNEVRSYEESMQEVASLHEIQNQNEAIRQALDVVNKSLVHPDWFKVDPIQYRQLIPAWDNYFLHFIGRYSGLPQFERYHFVDYKRSIRRGIGVCGDASVVLSAVLDGLGIDNQIISFEGHVIVGYRLDSGVWQLADPDFGVLLTPSLEQLIANAESIRNDYLKAGYLEAEISFLERAFRTRAVLFDNVYQFMKLRFIFEYVSYVMKWVLPVLLMLPCLWLQLLRYRARQ